MRTLGAISTMTATAALFAVALSIVAIRTLGMGTFVVTGASMEPTIHKGSLVIVEPVAPNTVLPGDIVTFEHYGQVTTHRVVAVDAAKGDPVFTTKGDANAVADPEPVRFPGQVGVVRASLPLVGYGVAYIQAYWRLVLMIVAAVVFFGCGGLLVFTNGRRAGRRTPRPVLVALDSEEVWRGHVGWLRERAAAQIRAA